jgi:hypothetical protein
MLGTRTSLAANSHNVLPYYVIGASPTMRLIGSFGLATLPSGFLAVGVNFQRRSHHPGVGGFPHDRA